MNWTNRATEQVAELIRNEDAEWERKHRAPPLWESIAEHVGDEWSDANRAKKLAQTIKYLFCGELPKSVDRVFHDQRQEYVDFAHVLGIDYATVDWLQIAEWIIRRFGNRIESKTPDER